MISRRGLLAVAGLGFAGCSGTPETPPPTATPDAGPLDFTVEYHPRGPIAEVRVAAAVGAGIASLDVEASPPASGGSITLVGAGGRRIKGEPGRVTVPEYPMSIPMTVIVSVGAHTGVATISKEGGA